jgi:hypothetical protein
MQTRLFTLLFGLASIVLGILGFIPALRTSAPANHPALDVTSSFGNLFSIFPVNLAHNLGSIAIGLIAVVASSNAELARRFCIAGFLVFGLLMIFGFIPELDTLWRLAPIYGDDTWLDAGASLLCGYFGFVVPEPTYVEPAPGHAH